MIILYPPERRASMKAERDAWAATQANLPDDEGTVELLWALCRPLADAVPSPYF